MVATRLYHGRHTTMGMVVTRLCHGRHATMGKHIFDTNLEAFNSVNKRLQADSSGFN